jgi:nitrous oxide reductase accessory protein NosL
MHTRHKSSFSLILVVITCAIVSLPPVTAGAAELMDLPSGSKLDLTQKCPVCGMVIGGKDAQGVTVTYKDGRVVGFGAVAAAAFKDGHVAGFEGARCLFIYNSVPEKYNVNVADIAHQYVTDFVSKKVIELPKAFLVLGSNVKGPMGYELIPFTNKDDAAKFASENDGKWIVQLHEVTRTAQEEAGKTGVAGKGETPTRDQKIEATPAPEASAIQPQETDTVRRERSPVRQRDGGGHHGGMH